MDTGVIQLDPLPRAEHNLRRIIDDILDDSQLHAHGHDLGDHMRFFEGLPNAQVIETIVLACCDVESLAIERDYDANLSNSLTHLKVRLMFSLGKGILALIT